MPTVQTIHTALNPFLALLVENLPLLLPPVVGALVGFGLGRLVRGSRPRSNDSGTTGSNGASGANRSR